MEEKVPQYIEKLILDPTFRAWCLGESNTENARYWEDWISENSYQREVGLMARAIVLKLEKAYEPVSVNRKFEAWQELSDRIDIDTEIESEWDKSPAPASNNLRNDARRGWMYTAAAVVLLLLISFSTLYVTSYETLYPREEQVEQPQRQTLATDFGEKKYITLSNGTGIILNSNSSLTYLDGWTYNKKVHVELEGEAFFAVTERTSANDPAFQVETKDGTIRVMGTRFDVSTWNNSTKVVLEEGKVAINQGTPGSDNPDAILSPDQMAEFSEMTEHININNVNTAVYTSWIKGLLTFDHTPLPMVAERIENTYGVNVIISDEIKELKKLSGSIESQNIDVIVSALSRILEVPVTHTDNKVVIGRTRVYPSTHESENSNGQRNEE